MKSIEKVKGLIRDEEGATMVEYGIMIGLIAAVSIVVVGTIGTKVFNAFTTTDTKMSGSPFAGT